MGFYGFLWEFNGGFFSSSCCCPFQKYAPIFGKCGGLPPISPLIHNFFLFFFKKNRSSESMIDYSWFKDLIDDRIELN